MACDEYFIAYGADAEKIIRYPFTSVREEEIDINIPEKGRKDELREKLGMKEEKIVLAVGQFIPRKGFDILLKAVSNLPEEVGVYLLEESRQRNIFYYKMKTNLIMYILLDISQKIF